MSKTTCCIGLKKVFRTGTLRETYLGVPIPKLEVKGKVFYGWFDNHLSYISSFVTYVKRQKKVGLDEARRA